MKVLKREKDGVALYTISGLTEDEFKNLREGVSMGALHCDDSAARLVQDVKDGKAKATPGHASLVKSLQQRATVLRKTHDFLASRL